MNFKTILCVSAMTAMLSLGAAAHAQTITNPDFVGTGGQGGYGEFYPDPTVATNYNSNYAVQIAGWNAPQTSGVNNGAPFLFSVNPTTLDTAGFPDSWDNSHPQLWGLNNGGTAAIGAPPNGATSALLLDADYHITPIYQNLSGLTVGQEYTVSFDWAAGQWAGRYGPTTEGLEIGLGGRVIQIAALNPSSGVNGFNLPSQGFSGWRTFTASFIYEGDPTTMTYGVDYGGETYQAAANALTFIAEGSPQGLPPTLLLTGVSLTPAAPGTPVYVNPVPEPSVWALMFVGLAGLGVAARLKRRHAVARFA